MLLILKKVRIREERVVQRHIKRPNLTGVFRRVVGEEQGGQGGVGVTAEARLATAAIVPGLGAYENRLRTQARGTEHQYHAYSAYPTQGGAV